LTRNIGISVKKSTKSPTSDEKNNPFNGSLSIRGKLFEGIVVNAKAKHTVTIEKKSSINFSKFRRYGRSKNRIHAHAPSNLDIKEGDRVIAAECRPISKSVSFVIIEVNP
jgi:small subunit ribosomal protein S17